MTNKERANSLAVYSRRESISCVDLANAIERALDEVKLEGRREMRERAAGECCGFLVPHPQNIRHEVSFIIEEKIRALPIEGE